MGQIPGRYAVCNIDACAQGTPDFILEGECPDDGTWILATMCAKHARQATATGTLAVCERCDGMLPLDSSRPWSSEDAELLRLGALGLS
jgi:hypothetical protein